MAQNIERVEAIMTAAPVIAVLIVNDPKKAVPMAEALVRGGIPGIEITLRTPNALDCIKAVADNVEGALVGAGTVLNHQQYEASVKAGSTFVVSPGATDNLIAAAEDFPQAPLLPGAGTASEVMKLLEAGYERLKFFPAVPAGGTPMLKGLSSPLAAAKFCQLVVSTLAMHVTSSRCQTFSALVAPGLQMQKQLNLKTGQASKSGLAKLLH